MSDYDAGVRDGLRRAAVMIRRDKRFGDLSLLACDVEDAANATTDPATCTHRSGVSTPTVTSGAVPAMPTCRIWTRWAVDDA